MSKEILSKLNELDVKISALEQSRDIRIITRLIDRRAENRVHIYEENIWQKGKIPVTKKDVDVWENI